MLLQQKYSNKTVVVVCTVPTLNILTSKLKLKLKLNLTSSNEFKHHIDFHRLLQNGQTHSNNSSANCWRIVWVFDHFIRLVLKGSSEVYLGSCQTSTMELFAKISLMFGKAVNMPLLLLLHDKLWSVVDCSQGLFKISKFYKQGLPWILFHGIFPNFLKQLFLRTS